MSAHRKRPTTPPYMRSEPKLASPVRKYSVTIRGHHTSLSLEPEFYAALKEIATERGIPIGFVVEEIDRDRMHGNLCSAVRLFCLKYSKDEIARRKLADHAETDMGAEARV